MRKRLNPYDPRSVMYASVGSTGTKLHYVNLDKRKKGQYPPTLCGKKCIVVKISQEPVAEQRLCKRCVAIHD